MPEMDGVTLLREVRKMEDPPVFVAVTALDTDDTMLEVLAAGGAGYIVKSSRPQTIISAFGVDSRLSLAVAVIRSGRLDE